MVVLSPAGELLALAIAMPGIFMMLAVLTLAALAVLFTVKTIVSGAVLVASGMGYAGAGIYIVTRIASPTVQMLAFALMVFGLGQLAFGTELLLRFMQKKKRHGLE